MSSAPKPVQSKRPSTDPVSNPKRVKDDFFTSQSTVSSKTCENDLSEQKELLEMFKPLLLTRAESDAKLFMALTKLQKQLVDRETIIKSVPAILPTWVGKDIRVLFDGSIDPTVRSNIIRYSYDVLDPFNAIKLKKFQNDWDSRYDRFFNELRDH
jgi:hypothetical protein